MYSLTTNKSNQNNEKAWDILPSGVDKWLGSINENRLISYYTTHHDIVDTATL